jgi:hypothetical protein
VWLAQRIPRPYSQFSGPETLQVAPQLYYEAKWTPFQTDYFSENLVVPGIEPVPSGSVSRNSDHLNTETMPPE